MKHLSATNENLDIVTLTELLKRITAVEESIPKLFGGINRIKEYNNPNSSNWVHHSRDSVYSARTDVIEGINAKVFETTKSSTGWRSILINKDGLLNKSWRTQDPWTISLNVYVNRPLDLEILIIRSNSINRTLDFGTHSLQPGWQTLTSIKYPLLETTDNELCVMFYQKTVTQGDVMAFEWVQLEQSDIRSTPRPAPEDILDRLTLIEQKIGM